MVGEAERFEVEWVVTAQRQLVDDGSGERGSWCELLFQARLLEVAPESILTPTVAPLSTGTEKIAQEPRQQQ